ncbi:MAG: hypothetical protein KBC74_01000 [Candidatus Pacebacteria bacterium]|nr:hypothetical protein [Candidatus Paceibacterota bacterium]
MGSRYEGRHDTQKKPRGAALLAAITLGFAGDAGAQDAPRRSWEYGDMSPTDAAYCRRAAETETRVAREGRHPNMGNLCSFYDLPADLRSRDEALYAREAAAESPADRARRQAQDAKRQKEEDELIRYCVSVNYVGERCSGM